MYSFAILDDEEEFLKILENKLTHFLFDMDIDGQIIGYNDPSVFLEQVKSKKFDIILLDIDMPKLDGISLAKKLRNIKHSPIVIFVTSKEEFMPHAFGLNIFAFLIKNNLENELESTLKECLKCIEKNRKVIFKTNKGLCHMSTDDIICIYSEGRKIKLITYFDEYQIYQETLASINKKLNNHQFIYPNRGSIVNLGYVKNTKSGCVTLAKTEHIEYISRDKIKKFDRILTEFILQERAYQ